MPFRADQLVIERLDVQLTYHSAYTYWSLKGVLAERWAHGPIFGAYGEQPQQISLQPSPDTGDRRILAAYGLKASGLNAEGARWTSEAGELASAWLNDVYEVLQPKKTVNARTNLMALYPIRHSAAVSKNLRQTFYVDEKLRASVPQRFADRFHAATQWMYSEGDQSASGIVGVVGPPTGAISSSGTTKNETTDGGWGCGSCTSRNPRMG